MLRKKHDAAFKAKAAIEAINYIRFKTFLSDKATMENFIQYLQLSYSELITFPLYIMESRGRTNSP